MRYSADSLTAFLADELEMSQNVPTTAPEIFAKYVRNPKHLIGNLELFVEHVSVSVCLCVYVCVVSMCLYLCVSVCLCVYLGGGGRGDGSQMGPEPLHHEVDRIGEQIVMQYLPKH